MFVVIFYGDNLEEFEKPIGVDVGELIVVTMLGHLLVYLPGDFVKAEMVMSERICMDCCYLQSSSSKPVRFEAFSREVVQLLDVLRAV